jgi:hypothetical protein
MQNLSGTKFPGPLSSSCEANRKDGAKVDKRLKPPVSYLFLMQALSHLILQMAHAHPPLNSGAASPSASGLLEGLGPFPSPEAKLLVSCGWHWLCQFDRRDSKSTDSLRPKGCGEVQDTTAYG